MLICTGSPLPARCDTVYTFLSSLTPFLPVLPDIAGTTHPSSSVPSGHSIPGHSIYSWVHDMPSSSSIHQTALSLATCHLPSFQHDPATATSCLSPYPLKISSCQTSHLTFGKLSCCHCLNLVTPRIVWTHLLWNTVKCRIWSVFKVHVSAPYIRTDITSAWYTALLTDMESSELLKTARVRQPKVLADLAILPSSGPQSEWTGTHDAPLTSTACHKNHVTIPSSFPKTALWFW